MPKRIDVSVDTTLDPLKIIRMIADGKGCEMFGNANCGVDGCNCSERLATFALYMMGYEVHNNVGLKGDVLRTTAEGLHLFSLAIPTLDKVR